MHSVTVGFGKLNKMPSEAKKIDLNNSYLIEKKMLTVVGFYPTRENRFKYFFLFNAFIAWILIYTQVVTIIVEMYMKFDDIPLVAQTLSVCVQQIALIIRLSFFSYHRSKHFLLEEMLDDPIINNRSKNQDAIIRKTINHCNMMSYTYKGICIICGIFYLLYPLLDNNMKHPLALPEWFPWDIIRYRLATLMYQVITIGISAYIGSTIDIVTYTLISLMSAQFEVLKDNLQNMRKGFKGTEHGTGDDVVLKRLQAYVVHHNTILTFVDFIQNIFSYGIFFQLFGSVLVICTTGFQMLLVSKASIQFVNLIFYLVCMIWQFGMYCWYGHEIMVASEGIRDACYFSEWYNCGNKVRKVIFIIMERSKRPVVLTAGKLFPLTLACFLSILRSSYSYFAVLQTLYSKKDL